MSTTQLQYIRYGLPTYWMAVCVSNGMHKSFDDWGCHSNDDVECVMPTSEHLVTGYGLNKGTCATAFGIYYGVFTFLLLFSGISYVRSIQPLETEVVTKQQMRKRKVSVEEKAHRDRERRKSIEGLAANVAHSSILSSVFGSKANAVVTDDSYATLEDSTEMQEFTETHSEPLKGGSLSSLITGEIKIDRQSEDESSSENEEISISKNNRKNKSNNSHSSKNQMKNNNSNEKIKNYQKSSRRRYAALNVLEPKSKKNKKGWTEKEKPLLNLDEESGI